MSWGWGVGGRGGLVILLFLPPGKRSFGEGYFFLPACVILFTGGLCLCPEGLCPRGSLSKGEGGLCQANPPTIKSGRYAFYWNAFLLF